MRAVKPFYFHTFATFGPKNFFSGFGQFCRFGFFAEFSLWPHFGFRILRRGVPRNWGVELLVVGSVGTASRHCTLSAGEVSRLEGPCRSGLTGVACSSGRHSSQVIPQPGAGFDSFLGRKTLAWSKCPRYTPKLSRALSA